MQLPDWGCGVREVDREFLNQVADFFAATLGRYHQYSLAGAENLPREGGVLLITSHGMATYELFLMGGAIFKSTGRPMRSLAAGIWFRTDALGSVFERLGMVDTGPDVARQLLDAGNIVALAPGGTREAIRPWTKRFQVDWKGRTGFARLALEAQKPIVLVTCPAIDLVFKLYENPLTTFAYRQWKVPLPIMRGVGPTLIPRPIRLTAHCSPSFLPPKIAGERPTEDEVQAYRDELNEKMETFMRDVCIEEGLSSST